MIRKIISTYRSSFSGLNKETWLLSIVMLINRASTMVVPFMSMYITQSMHRSIAEAGLVITLFGVGSVLGSAVGGHFIDKWGFRPILAIASFAGGMLFIGYGLISNFPVLCLLTVALAFVAEAVRPANTAGIAAYSTPDNLTRSFSLNRLATNLGWGIGFPFGGLLASVNYHLLFWVEGLVYLFIGIYVILLLPATSAKQHAASPTIAPAAGISPWKDRLMLRFLLLVTTYTTCFVLMFKLVPVYWKEQLHIGESRIGLLLGLNGLLIALFEMVLVKRWEGRRPGLYYIIAGAGVTAIAYAALILPGFNFLVMAVLSVVLLTLGEMMTYPFINTAIMSRADEHNRGKYAGAYALSWSVAQIAGPGGGALLIDRFGYSVLWIVLACLCLSCALAFKFLPTFSFGSQAI